MKRLALLTVLTLISTGAWGVDMEVPYSYDNSWVKTVRTLGLEGIVLSVTDKDSGIIQGSKSLDLNSKYFARNFIYFSCPRFEGRLTSYAYNITASVEEIDEASSSVSIQSRGFGFGYQNRKFIVINYDSVDRESSCENRRTRI